MSAASLAFPRLLTSGHRAVLKTIAESPLHSYVVFTGGTALASVYYGHRHSEDLDLFAQRPVDAGLLLPWQRSVTRQGFLLERQVLGARHRYFVTPPRTRTIIRLDVVEFPFEPIEPPRLVPQLALRVDSLLDIAVNKVHAITDRLEAKDFVDLYVLLHHHPSWTWERLLRWVRLKFDVHIDRLAFAHQLSSAERLRVWPRLTHPVPPATVKRFFLDEAQSIGRAAW